MQRVNLLRGSLLASCSPLSSRLMPELRAGQGGLPPTLPTQAINCWGFVGGGISLSPLALPAASAASSQYLSAYSASPPTWTTSLDWLPPYKPYMLNDLFWETSCTAVFRFQERNRLFLDESYLAQTIYILTWSMEISSHISESSTPVVFNLYCLTYSHNPVRHPIYWQQECQVWLEFTLSVLLYSTINYIKVDAIPNVQRIFSYKTQWSCNCVICPSVWLSHWVSIINPTYVSAVLCVCVCL